VPIFCLRSLFADEAALQRSIPAFPGAEGFGAGASGGRGGSVYHVVTLDDAGPGSFRDAVSQPGRTVVFDVGGLIALKSNVPAANNLTIAGQTAPGEGICLFGGSLSFSERSNIIVRYIRLRGGMVSDRGKKPLGMSKAERVIIDHCSIEWGRWDNLGITVGSKDITVQHCIIAEAIHPQSFGALVDSVENVTLSHNLWMSNESRNPKAKGTVEYINNVVYNWGVTGLCGGHSAAVHLLDVVGNIFIKGPSSNDNFAGQFTATDHVYQRDNLVDLGRDGKLNGQVVVNADFRESKPMKGSEKYSLPTFLDRASMHAEIPVAVQAAADAFATVVAGAGCSLRRDAVDRRLIEELNSLGTKGACLPHTNELGEALVGGQGEVIGGTVPIDTDHDGIPDAWEAAHKLDPQNPADGARITASGYSELELYLNSLTQPESMTSKSDDADGVGATKRKRGKA
jgi:pectate lyase